MYSGRNLVDWDERNFVACPGVLRLGGANTVHHEWQRQVGRSIDSSGGRLWATSKESHILPALYHLPL